MGGVEHLPDDRYGRRPDGRPSGGRPAGGGRRRPDPYYDPYADAPRSPVDGYAPRYQEPSHRPEDDSAYYRETYGQPRPTSSASSSSGGSSAADRAGGRHRAGARPYAGAASSRNRRRALPLWQEIPLLLIIAFVLATVIKTFVVQAFFIPSGSMERTLLVSDRVLVNKFVYDLREPRRGEVVVFRGTDSWVPENAVPTNTGTLATAGRMLGGLVGAAPPDEKDFVKRVIGVGGDTVQCCDKNGRVQVNGVSLVEPYVFEDNTLDERQFGPVKVPAGRLFMMGDHRAASADSRVYLSDQWRGTIPVNAVIGQAYATAWPISRWSLLQTPDTFSNVPTALGEPGRVAPRPTGAGALLVFPLLFGPFGAVGAGRAPRWLLRPDSLRHRRLRR
ncbi:signal peptidase I [Cryptosporangium phraense]|uniref:Signal peptidase I n=1 Tax=Cryptosporangium phraense TaxID=2593070 RepID=A0A545ASK9_9ACTN|nr:signal peptidase I [Cryptosporangium phraense]TQS44308.1 signal peptidase I [Cryptosporangium phraense]